MGRWRSVVECRYTISVADAGPAKFFREISAT